MAPTDTTDRTTFWQDHVTTWQASDLTQKAYCEAHGLRYATFGYWCASCAPHRGIIRRAPRGSFP